MALGQILIHQRVRKGYLKATSGKWKLTNSNDVYPLKKRGLVSVDSGQIKKLKSPLKVKQKL